MIHSGPSPNRLYPGPTAMKCPACKIQMRTKVEYQSSARTHLGALCCCLVGCIPLVWVPYVTKSCKSPHHYCPLCNHYLGECTDFRNRY